MDWPHNILKVRVSPSNDICVVESSGTLVLGLAVAASKIFIAKYVFCLRLKCVEMLKILISQQLVILIFYVIAKVNAKVHVES